MLTYAVAGHYHQDLIQPYKNLPQPAGTDQSGPYPPDRCAGTGLVVLAEPGVYRRG